jgi:hypothetical protein
MYRSLRAYVAPLGAGYVSTPGLAHAHSYDGLAVAMGAVGVVAPALVVLVVMGLVGLALKKKHKGARYGRVLQAAAVLLQLPYPILVLSAVPDDLEILGYACFFALPLAVTGALCFVFGGRLASTTVSD